MVSDNNKNVYVGHRYVPKIFGVWDKLKPYEPLSIVTWEGTSYTSKKRVPEGVDILNDEYWVVTGNYNAQVENYRQEVRDMQDEVNSKVNQSEFDRVENELSSQLADIAINVKSFGAIGDGVTDDTQAFIDAIDHIKTLSQISSTPDSAPLGRVFIPNGKYVISSTIRVPTLITIEGNGRDNSILVSQINDGNPVIHCKGDFDTNQSYLNSISHLTIEATNKNCIGIKMENCSRWIIDNVKINECRGEGLFLYESYIGEVYSIFLRGCGDSERASVLLTGRNINFGNHATTFIGGEIAPGVGKKAGIHIEKACSVVLSGVTIQGTHDGYGVIDGDTVSTFISGCYFEENKGHILAENTQGANYLGNFMTLTKENSLGWIVIKKATGGKISGNAMLGDRPFPHIADFDSNTQTSQLTIEGNLVASLPLRLGEKIKSRITQGNHYSYFDGLNSVEIVGRHTYKNKIDFLDEIESRKLMRSYQYSLFNIGTEEVERNSLFRDGDGLKFKDGSDVVRKVQLARGGGTSIRPSNPTLGESYYDTSSKKPIWWDGAFWVDAEGNYV